MKKLTSMLLALALVLSLAVPAFADDSTDTTEKLTENGATSSGNINATYTESVADPTTTFSVSITWGSMSFTYSTGGTKVWNPANLCYEIESPDPKWTCDTGANVLTVVNHSNLGINATLAYKPSTEYGIEADLSVTSMSLPSAIGEAVNSEKLVGTTELTPTTGLVNETNTTAEAAIEEMNGTGFTEGDSNKTIGTITVTISGYRDAKDLQAAINAGGTVVLSQDIDLGNTTLEIPEGTTVTLDLNGYTISCSDGDAIKNEGTLTVKDSVGTGTISAGDMYTAVDNNGSLYVESGTVDHVRNEYGEVIISGGTVNYTIYGDVTVTGGTVTRLMYPETANISGGTVNWIEVPFGTATVSGGTIKGFSVDTNQGGTMIVTGGTFSSDPGSDYVADGYSAIDNGDGTYSVYKYFEVSNMDSLKSAAVNGAYIKLTDDITTDSNLRISSGVTCILDLNGHTLSSSCGDCAISNKGTLTVTDTSEAGGGKVENTTSDSGYAIMSNGVLNVSNCTVSGYYGINNYGTCTITDATVEANNLGIRCQNSSNLTVTGSSTVTGGTYGIHLKTSGNVSIQSSTVTGASYGVKVENGNATISGSTVEGYDAVYVQGGEVKIESGTFTGKVGQEGGSLTVTGGTYTRSDIVLFVYSGTTAIEGGTFNGSLHILNGKIITGGTFSEDPSDYVDTTAYKVTQNTDDDGNETWTVAPIG